MDNKNYYHAIAPRPTVCVSTTTGDGSSNLAPYSFVTPLSIDPPLVGVAVGEEKDTILNAREAGDFVVVPLTRDWEKQGIRTEISLPRGESEFEEVGLTESASEVVSSPGVKEASINIECTYWDEFETGDHFFLVGKVVHVAAQPRALKGDRINLETLGAVGHISGEEFCVADEVVRIRRE